MLFERVPAAVLARETRKIGRGPESSNIFMEFDRGARALIWGSLAPSLPNGRRAVGKLLRSIVGLVPGRLLEEGDTHVSYARGAWADT